MTKVPEFPVRTAWPGGAPDGLYPIVTHAFNFVGRGALGLLQGGDGDPLN